MASSGLQQDKTLDVVTRTHKLSLGMSCKQAGDIIWAAQLNRNVHQVGGELRPQTVGLCFIGGGA
jgi:hypothetical protein